MRPGSAPYEPDPRGPGQHDADPVPVWWADAGADPRSASGAPSDAVRPFLGTAAAEQTAPDPAPPEAGLRPFVLTAGRVDSTDPDIEVETQVTARSTAPPVPLAPELRAILSLCREPVSVAEISARLHLHLGVTRVLVGDLRATGHLEVHRLDPDVAHHPDTILRVIRGLRAIS